MSLGVPPVKGILREVHLAGDLNSHPANNSQMSKIFWKIIFFLVMEFIFGDKDILVDGSDRKKSHCLVGFLLLF